MRLEIEGTIPLLGCQDLCSLSNMINTYVGLQTLKSKLVDFYLFSSVTHFSGRVRSSSEQAIDKPLLARTLGLEGPQAQIVGQGLFGIIVACTTEIIDQTTL